MEAKNDAYHQGWVFQPLEKYKSKPVKPLTVQVELLSLPSDKLPVIYVRDDYTREGLAVFLHSLEVRQEARTKRVAERLTGISPRSWVHAERLIDAAIDKDILQDRVKRIEPLTGFWSLPLEIRSRVYKLAAGADGQFWPVSHDLFNRLIPQRPWGYEGLPVMRGFNSAPDQHFLPRSSRIAREQRLSWHGQDDPFEPTQSDMDASGQPEIDMSYRRSVGLLLTPALMSSSHHLRSEAVEAVYGQAEFCFFALDEFHNFLSKLRKDSLCSLRKVRLDMPLSYLMALFSLGRNCIGEMERETFDAALRMQTSSDDFRRFDFPGSPDYPIPMPIVNRISQNDRIFAEVATVLRLTRLTVNLSWVTGQHPWSLVPPASFRAGPLSAQRRFPLWMQDRWKQKGLSVQTNRLLLVKLMNLTLDMWTKVNGSDRPRLVIIWPDDVLPEQLQQLNVVNAHYRNIDVSKFQHRSENQA